MVQRGILKKVLKAQLCSGCGACASMDNSGSCKMKMDSDGYLRPHNVSAISASDEKKIANVCPGVGMDSQVIGELDNYNPIWGPIHDVRAGWATDSEERYKGSSGGVITAITKFLLTQNIVDEIVHVGASSSDPITNETRTSSSPTDIISAAGSRYSPSSPLYNITKYKGSDRTVAVVGKPCDIAALRALTAIDSELKKNIKYMIAFFCAGVPSTKGTQHLLKAMGANESELISFDYRGKGWPGYARAVMQDGSERTMEYEKSWGGILNRYLQFRCKVCPDGTGEFADISCADAWHCDERGYPLFEEQGGRSLVISRNSHGEKLIQQMIKEDKIEVEEMNAADIEKFQPYQARRKQLTLSRLWAMRTLLKFSPKYKGFHLLSVAIDGGLKPNVRSYIGMLFRLIKASKRV